MAAQLPDSIVLEGERMDLYSNPLEAYWERFKKKRPNFLAVDSCKRGYIATWEIRGAELLLKALDGNIARSSFFFWKKFIPYTVRTLFPKANGKAIKANWFSGKLRIPRGNMTRYDHYGYNSRFEKETIISVERGNVVKSVTLDYTNQKLVTSN